MHTEYKDPSLSQSSQEAQSTRSHAPRKVPHAGNDQDDIVIAVMGPTGAGKSQFINTASNSTKHAVGDSLISCTSAVEPSVAFRLGGRNVVLLDTPGFDDTTKSDAATLEVISQYLATTYADNVRLSGVIYLHRIAERRMTGAARRNFRVFQKLCGDSTLKNVVVATTMWDTEPEASSNAREAELMTSAKCFRPALKQGATMMRHYNTRASAEDILRKIIGNHPTPLKIQTQVVDEAMGLGETDAGGELIHEMAEMARTYREELAEVRRRMQETQLDKDREAQRELERTRQLCTAHLQQLERDLENMAARRETEKRHTDERLYNAEAALNDAHAPSIQADTYQPEDVQRPKKKWRLLKALALGVGCLIAPHLCVLGAITALL